MKRLIFFIVFVFAFQPHVVSAKTNINTFQKYDDCNWISYKEYLNNINVVSNINPMWIFNSKSNSDFRQHIIELERLRYRLKNMKFSNLELFNLLTNYKRSLEEVIHEDSKLLADHLKYMNYNNYSFYQNSLLHIVTKQDHIFMEAYFSFNKLYTDKCSKRSLSLTRFLNE